MQTNKSALEKSGAVRKTKGAVEMIWGKVMGGVAYGCGLLVSSEQRRPGHFQGNIPVVECSGAADYLSSN